MQIARLKRVIHYTTYELRYLRASNQDRNRKLQYRRKKCVQCAWLYKLVEIVVGKIQSNPRGPCRIMRNIAYLRKGLRDPPVFVGVIQYDGSGSGDCLTDAAYDSAAVGGLEGIS